MPRLYDAACKDLREQSPRSNLVCKRMAGFKFQMVKAMYRSEMKPLNSHKKCLVIATEEHGALLPVLSFMEDKILLIRVVSRTNGAQRVPAGQITISNEEVGVTLNIAGLIQPRDGVANESCLRSRINTRLLELGDPDLVDTVAGSEVVCLGDVALKVGVDGIGIPMDGHGGLTALAVAGLEVGLHPCKTHWGATVGDGGGDQFSLVLVRGDPFLVQSSGGGSVDVGLGVEIGLVESENVCAAAGEGGFDVGGPSGGVGSPEHGHVFDAGGEAATGRAAPVVGPGSVGDEADKAGVVVSSALFGVGALGEGLGGSCKSCCHHRRGDNKAGE